ncbi:MAG: cysteine--tRNA ligase [Candidatus Magasanikbacteria bacterium]
MSIYLYNTLSRRIEEFKPIKKNKVGLYACGPTVYNYAHIGNLRTYVFEDILKRTLQYGGYKIKHVMNITDVGHLTDDADAGEDKMEKGSVREGKTAWQLAEFYTHEFRLDLEQLNILEPMIWCRATDHIKEQIKLIKKLEKNGFTYATSDGIYFDTSKLKDYGKLANLQNQELRAGVRVDIGDKKNTTDFALWKFSPKLQKRQMEWKSPWGVGFPGWHIECSAMATKYLGQPFDIHCGGVDHIPVHHTNEIAQSEAAYDTPLANYWIHGEFLLMGSDKMAKSGDNFVTLRTLKEKKINPLAYRFLLLQTHYRKQLTFSWEALAGAQNGLDHLYSVASALPDKTLSGEEEIKNKFVEKINDDLNTPIAIAQIWEAIKTKTISLPTLLQFDKILGLKIQENLHHRETAVSEEATKLVEQRNTARANRDWVKSDELRVQLEALGYVVKDTASGTQLIKN